jgi:prenyl protein peptidase
MPNEMTFAEAPPPLISPRAALLCAFLFTAFYVAPFYLSPTLRSVSIASRDSPSVIRARVRSVTLACIACAVVNVYILAVLGHATPRDVLSLWGVWPIYFLDTLKPVALTLVLFVGPLFKTLVAEGEWRNITPSSIKTELFDSWTGYRNIIVAPLSEELVFRSLVISLYLLAKVSPTRIVFTTPLIFGMAHLHHLYTNLRSQTPPGCKYPPLIAWLQCIAVSLFQFTYTSLFGFFAAFALLRTGNVYGVVLVHSFCNWMGVPQFWGRIGQYEPEYTHTTPDVAQDGSEGSANGGVKVGNGMMQDEPESAEEEKARRTRQSGPQSLGVAWTAAYYALLVGGAWGFYKLLFPWTESSNALAMF